MGIDACSMMQGKYVVDLVGAPHPLATNETKFSLIPSTIAHDAGSANSEGTCPKRSYTFSASAPMNPNVMSAFAFLLRSCMQASALMSDAK